MTAKFELFKDRAGEFRWRLRHQNGNIIADSAEGYSTKAAAINGIESVKKNVSLANVSDKNISRSTESPRVVAAQLTSDVAGEKVVSDQMSESVKNIAPAQSSQTSEVPIGTTSGQASEAYVRPANEPQLSTESPRVEAAQLTSDVAGEKVVSDQMSESVKNIAPAQSSQTSEVPIGTTSGQASEAYVRPANEPQLSTESPRVEAAQLTSDVAGEKVVSDQMSESVKNIAPAQSSQTNEAPFDTASGQASEAYVRPANEPQPSKPADRPASGADSRAAVPNASQSAPKAAVRTAPRKQELLENDLVTLVAIIVAAAFFVLAAGIILLNG